MVDPIDGDTLNELEKQHDVTRAFGATTESFQKLIPDAEVLIFRSGVTVSAAVMECAPDLKLLIRAGSGIDNLDLEYVHRHGLQLVRIPEPGAQAVAEMTFAFMLALSRNLILADHMTRRGRWLKHELHSHLLAGRTLGIIGAGNIGSRVGQVGAAMDMEVIGCVEHPSPVRAAELSARGIHLVDFDQVITQADYLSVHVSLKDSTRNLINADVLARIKPGAFLMNLARGGVVDEHALFQALTEGGRLGGAALDVHKAEGEGKISPLAELPNVILTPHIGAMTIETQREIGRRIKETVNAFVAERVRETVSL
ncbi:MAG TPA: NAD(P)-dependent oxidoreductase [Anaerolineae bacterium]